MSKDKKRGKKPAKTSKNHPIYNKGIHTVSSKSKKVQKQNRLDKKRSQQERDPNTKQKYNPILPKVKTGKLSAEDNMKQSKFRFLNEMLYTQDSKGATDLF